MASIWGRTLRYGLVIGVLSFLWAPNLATFYSALNDSEFVGSAFRGLTLRWFIDAAGNAEFWRVLAWSLVKALIVGMVATALSVVVGLAAALSGRAIEALIYIAMLILFCIPPSAFALNLLETARSVGAGKGIGLVLIGQLAQALPVCFFVLSPAIAAVPTAKLEAAVLLGMSKHRALWRYMIKEVRFEAVLCFALAMFVSLDDLASSVYLDTPTAMRSLTAYIWQGLRSDLSPRLMWYSIFLSAITFVTVGSIILRAHARGVAGKAE